MTRLSIALASAVALCVFVGGYLYNRDQHVARDAVQQHKERAREVVKKAKAAQRRVDPDSARGVLDSKYCSGC